MRPVKDPAPSRLSYRLNRLMLRRGMRGFLRFGAPTLLVAAIAGLWIADEARRQELWAHVESVKLYIEERPEFMVHMVSVQGASATVTHDIRDLLNLDFPVSSFDLELEDLRSTLEEIPAVKTASLQVRSGGVLSVDVVERQPAVIWRQNADLFLLDAEGFHIGTLQSRFDRSDLPLLAGAGASDAVDEALALFAAAEPFQGRIRALERVGLRRWDIVLDQRKRIMLPEQAPVAALEHVIALDAAQDLIARDISHIDFRNDRRLVLRMANTASETPDTGRGAE